MAKSRKTLRVAAIVVGVLIAVIAILAIVLTIVIDPNRYRGDIVRAVKTQTGRDLKIEGKLHLSLFPWIGLGTGRLELSNAPGFGPTPFAVVDGANVKVELLPLLHKQIVVNAIRLNGVQLHLARRADGRTNWEDLAAHESPGSAQHAPTPAPKAGNGAGAALAAFTVERFEMRRSLLTWRDAGGGTYALRDLQLTSGNLLGPRAAPLHLAFDLESSEPRLSQRVVLDARLRFDPKTQTLDAPDLTLGAGDIRVHATLHANKLLTAPALRGSIDIPEFDPRPTLKRFGVAYAPADAGALQKLALAANFELTPQEMALSHLKASLDDTRVTGSLARRQSSAAAYRFDVALDGIDVDRYLPAAAPGSKQSKGKASNAGAAVVIPIGLLRDTRADGQLRIGTLKAFGIRSRDVAVKLTARDGRVTLGPDTAKLYGGTYAGRTVVDASARTPRLQFAEKLAGVQLGPLLKDAAGLNRYTGTGNVSLNLTAHGLDAAAVKRSLNGTAAFNVKNGAIDGFDLRKIEAKIREIRDRPGGTGKDLLASLPEFSPAAGDKTTFTHLQASVTVVNGVATNKDLAIVAPPLRVTGSGTINLATGTFDNYILKLGNIPLVISGAFAEPKVRPDWNAILRAKTERTIEHKKEELLDKLRNRLLDRFRR